MKKKLLKGNPVLGFMKWRLMLKASLVTLIVLSIQLRAIAQAGTFSRSYTNASVEKVFKDLQQNSKYRFVYVSGDIKQLKSVNHKFENATIVQVVEFCLKDSGLGFEIDGNSIVIKPKAEDKKVIKPDKKEKIEISGKVLDKDGLSLPGATVLISETNEGVITDPQGKFTLNVPSEKTVLRISFVGFENQLVTVGSKRIFTITLKESTTQLDEVVVTGVFTRKAESFTGSVQTFKKEDIRRVSNTNVLKSIKNLDPSFNIQENFSNGSDPNQAYQITIRGQSGFPDVKGEYANNPNLPLFIVDGFEASLEYVTDMDMDRVANVTLLKDASAKAIYGSKAANGVVVIETVKPKAGKMRVSYTGSMNIELPDLRSYNLCNAAEKLQVEKDGGLFLALTDNGVDITTNPVDQYEYDQYYNRILAEVLAGVNTDWKYLPLQNGIGQKHSMFLEGGDDSFIYGLDFSYNDVVGVMKESGRKTFSGGITFSYRYKTITLRNKLSVTYNKGNNSPYGSYSQYTSMNPYLRYQDENGNIIKQPGINFGREDIYNPLWNTTINTKNFTEYLELVNNFYVEWAPIEKLKLTGRVGIIKNDSGNEIFYPASHTNFAGWEEDDALVDRRGSYTYGDGKSFNISSDIIGSYSVLFGEKHLIFANAGWSMTNSKYEYTTFVAEGFTNDKLDNISFARQYAEGGRPSVVESTTRDMGFLGAINYSYDDRYLFDASFRFSGSSQFGSENRWGKFWSLGLGWNIHNEGFMKNLKDNGVITQVKLRGSMGFTGSQNFNSYQALATYNYYTSDSYYGNIGAYLAAMPNNNLKWQRKLDKNIGLDLTLFKNRLSVRFDYYHANTDDLLTDVTIPSSTGFTSYKENLGEVENTGYEIYLKYRVWSDPENQSFFNVFVSGSHNRNRIKKISNYLQSYNDTQTSTVSNKPITRYMEGQSLSAIWAVPSYGIDPASGRELYITPEGNRTYIWDEDYLAISGDTEPDLRGNFGFNMDYKGLSVNVAATYYFGGQYYNQTLVDKVENADLHYNVDRRIFEDRWVEPGDVSLYKDIKNTATTRATSRFVENNNVLSISSINISYELTKLAFIEKTGVERMKLSFDMADVARISSIKTERGTNYPFARKFSFSLQVTF